MPCPRPRSHARLKTIRSGLNPFGAARFRRARSRRRPTPCAMSNSIPRRSRACLTASSTSPSGPIGRVRLGPGSTGVSCRLRPRGNADHAGIARRGGRSMRRRADVGRLGASSSAPSLSSLVTLPLIRTHLDDAIGVLLDLFDATTTADDAGSLFADRDGPWRRSRKCRGTSC